MKTCNNCGREKDTEIDGCYLCMDCMRGMQGLSPPMYLNTSSQKSLFESIFGFSLKDVRG